MSGRTLFSCRKKERKKEKDCFVLYNRRDALRTLSKLRNEEVMTSMLS